MPLRLPTTPSRRLVVALSVASVAGWISGLMHHGALGARQAPPRWMVAVVALGGLVGGLIRGVSMFTRGLYVVPFALYCATLTFTTSSYLDARGRISNAELLLPSAAAMIPFSLVYRAVGRHQEPSTRRREDRDA